MRLNSKGRSFAAAVAEMVYCNPFSPARIDCERQALGEDFQPTADRWSLTPREFNVDRPNITLIAQRVESLVDWLAPDPDRLGSEDRALFDDLSLYRLYERYRLKLQETADAGRAGKPVRYWDAFAAEFAAGGLPGDPAHVFACFFQVRRAFSNIFYYLVGRSRPAGRLREAVWESIFTHDLRRYYTSLYRGMGDMTTLILGQTGTGKELVAQAIGRSRYIPFDPKSKRFVEDFAGSFLPVNLSALSPTLIESELFGHKRGAFTGATDDRAGWLETCPDLGTVFLDEVGELDPTIQVKLLRVLQTRMFQRLGDSKDRRFAGKIIAATHRDLPRCIAEGSFREDFYFRLCSDVIHTPTLREQLDDSPGDLRAMVRFVIDRMIEQPGEARAVTARVVEALDDSPGGDYAWPGNFRELEQAVRNVVIRGRYEPRSAPIAADDGPEAALLDALRDRAWTADELLNAACTVAYAQCDSYVAAGERLRLDRRTVKARVDEKLLRRLGGGE